MRFYVEKISLEKIDTSNSLKSKDKRMVLAFNLFSFHTRYAGRLFVKSYDKPSDILERLNQLAGYAPNEEIELCEVCYKI